MTDKRLERKLKELLVNHFNQPFPGKTVIPMPELRKALSNFRYKVGDLIELANGNTRIDIEIMPNGMAEVSLPQEVWEDE